MSKKVEVKITIAKLLEVAYSKNKGVTTKIIKSKGNYKLTVDAKGNTTLSGSVGMLTFNGGSALQGLGAKIKNASITFKKGDSNNIKYTATFNFVGAAGMSISGSFDIEELILSCSGLLCRAAKALKARHAAYEMELKRIMDY